MKIFIESYGCSANASDAEIMAGLLKNSGFELTKSKDADIIILNTCVVKKPTESKMIFRIKQLSGKKLIVAGCMPEVEAKLIEAISPNASIISTNCIEKIAEVVNAVKNGKKVIFLGRGGEEKVGLPKCRENPIREIVQISSGCNSHCSYCIVKKIKGKTHSYSIEKIVGNVENSIKNGCKEIWLTSQDCAAYGLDIGASLPELIEKIIAIDGKFKVRIGMMNPKDLSNILDQLIELYKSDKLYKFVHIPVQSGSDKVLGKMNRGYNIGEFKQEISKLRKIRDMTVWTDIIVGFPDETEEDFQQTIDLIKEVRPDVVNLSKFGARPNTAAAKMKQLPGNTIKERSSKMAKICLEIALEKNKKWVGKEVEVLINEVDGRSIKGKTESYKQAILRSGRLGDFVNAKVVGASPTSLFCDKK